jgi:hypothetical protein
MSYRAVAETYAQERGLKFVPKLTVRSAPTLGSGYESVANAIVGPVAGTRDGILYLYSAGRAIGPPAAQFEIPGLAELIDGLWVRRSGLSFWTRIKVPKGYSELTVPDDAFTAKFRAALVSADDAPVAQRLLDRDFTHWYVDHGPQGGSRSQAGTFEISGGVLFVRGAPACFSDAEKLDTFAVAVAGLADRIAAQVPSPQGAQ